MSIPTIGDLGLTWDEPAYRYSQVISAHWWEQLGGARSRGEVEAQLDPVSLLYYWPYGRHGINFHPPWAGQLNLATYALFGRWMNDIPARRMATLIQFALTITIGFHFLARRYGFWVGAVMAGSLLFMPRLYGPAHLSRYRRAGAAAVGGIGDQQVSWKGLHEPRAGPAVAGRWSAFCSALGFIRAMAAVLVLLPLMIWLIVGGLARGILKPGARADWIDGVLTTGAMLAPLGLAFQQIQILQRQLPPPKITDLFVDQPASDWSGAILAIPLLVWLLRRLLGWIFRKNSVWGRRPEA